MILSVLRVRCQLRSGLYQRPPLVLQIDSASAVEQVPKMWVPQDRAPRTAVICIPLDAKHERCDFVRTVLPSLPLHAIANVFTRKFWRVARESVPTCNSGCGCRVRVCNLDSRSYETRSVRRRRQRAGVLQARWVLDRMLLQLRCLLELLLDLLLVLLELVLLLMVLKLQLLLLQLLLELVLRQCLLLWRLLELFLLLLRILGVHLRLTPRHDSQLLEATNAHITPSVN